MLSAFLLTSHMDRSGPSQTQGSASLVYFIFSHDIHDDAVAVDFDDADRSALVNPSIGGDNINGLSIDHR